MIKYKIVVAGNSGVGKSSIITAMTKEKKITIEGKMCLFEILNRSIIYDDDIRKGHGFVLIYSINSRSSYDAVIDIHNKIVSIKGDEFKSIVLCGNKCDLDEERVITYHAATNMADTWGAQFFEISTVYSNNVDNIFYDLVKTIYTIYMNKKRKIEEIPHEGFQNIQNGPNYLKFLTNVGIIKDDEWNSPALKSFKYVSRTGDISTDEFIDTIFGPQFELLRNAFQSSFMEPVINAMNDIVDRMDKHMPCMIHTYIDISHSSIISIIGTSLKNNLEEEEESDNENFANIFQSTWVRNLISQCLMAKGVPYTQSTYACYLYLTITLEMFIEHIYGIDINDNLKWIPQVTGNEKDQPKKAFDELCNLFKLLCDVCDSLKQVREATVSCNLLSVSFSHPSMK